MTREEEIKQAEIKYSDDTLFDGCDYIGQYAKQEAFIAGAKWADEHPRKDFVSIDDVCKQLGDQDMTKYISGIFAGPASISFNDNDLISDFCKIINK